MKRRRDWWFERRFTLVVVVSIALSAFWLQPELVLPAFDGIGALFDIFLGTLVIGFVLIVVLAFAQWAFERVTGRFSEKLRPEKPGQGSAER